MAKTETPQQLITRPEAAAALAVSLRTLDAMIAAGELPVVRLSRAVVRIRPSSISYLIEARENRNNPRTGRARACCRK